MSRFYGSLQGSKGLSTRQGTSKGGLTAHIRGWDVGVLIRCTVDENGNDKIFVSRTGGSNNPSVTSEICIVRPLAVKTSEKAKKGALAHV